MDRRSLLASAAATALTAGPRSGIGRPVRSWIPDSATLAELPKWMDLASVPGLGMAVVEDGVLAWNRGFGVANADTRTPVTADSVFPAASLGKPVFGYVVLQLVDEGRLDLDRPLIEYFRPAGLAASAERVTARHVLSHTSGLPNWRGRSDTSLAAEFEPGIRFRYSGEGFFWLGQAVESILGQGIEGVMRARLFEPAGMARATYVWSADHERWTVEGHNFRGVMVPSFLRRLSGRLLAVADSTGRPMREWTSADALRALATADSTLPAQPNNVLPNVAASLLCTGAEYGRFLALTMAGRRRAPWEITEDRRRAMITPQVAVKPTLSWGLGWGLERRADAGLLWHWGDNGIFRAFTVVDPDRRRGLVVFTNGDGGPKVYQRLIRATIGVDLAAFVWV